MLNLMRNTLKTLIECKKFDRVLEKVKSNEFCFHSNVKFCLNVIKGWNNKRFPTDGSPQRWKWRTNQWIIRITCMVVWLLPLSTSCRVWRSPQQWSQLKILNPDSNFAKVKSVSLDLSITYLKAIQRGETILIEANTLRLGNKIAFLSVDIFNKNTNELVCHRKTHQISVETMISILFRI